MADVDPDRRCFRGDANRSNGFAWIAAWLGLFTSRLQFGAGWSPLAAAFGEGQPTGLAIPLLIGTVGAALIFTISLLVGP